MYIYNTLTRKKERFKPRQENAVSLYVCGITVYDYCHIGHARMLVVFDLVSRYFRYRNYDLNYVRNITDIDDKIIQRAADNGESVNALTSRFIAAMHDDERALNVLPPDIEPRATEHMQQIIEMIEGLIDKGFAYIGTDGDVFYRVRKFDGYGKLSGKSLDELSVGARVDANESKEDPLDFVLWKMSKEGEPNWSSPWGKGRPGWHIECSAMSTHCLGNNFDIHAGGRDLQFPHHENEIAQSEAVTGVPFANLWMHNGFVNIDDEKMSKSLGNFFTVRDVLDQDENRSRMGEIIRYMIVSSHYRSPVNYSGAALENARSALIRVYQALSHADRYSDTAPEDESLAANYRQKFLQAMDDDFNSPEALAVVFDLVRDLNKSINSNQASKAVTQAAEIRSMGKALGLFYQSPELFLSHLEQTGTKSDALSDQEIDTLVKQRLDAKTRRNFVAADEIRDRLVTAGIVVEDLPGGKSSWRRK